LLQVNSSAISETLREPPRANPLVAGASPARPTRFLYDLG